MWVKESASNAYYIRYQVNHPNKKHVLMITIIQNT